MVLKAPFYRGYSQDPCFAIHVPLLDKNYRPPPSCELSLETTFFKSGNNRRQWSLDVQFNKLTSST